jgi:methylated-DNA-[protein]-cysteine S-methyltransferase
MTKELLVPWLQPSPLGLMLLVARPQGALVTLTWDTSPTEQARIVRLAGGELAPLHRLSERSDGSLEPAGLPPPLAAVAMAVDDYLHGRLRHPAVAIDYLLVKSDFYRQVLRALCDVAPGTTTTYGGLAKQLGRPAGAARAVGQAVGRNPIAIVVPCHRVVASDGSLGGFSGELWRKRQLLKLEGQAVPDGGWEVKRLASAAARVA